MSDPFWKRSSFGSLLFFLGSMGVFWIVDGVAPTSDQWIQALVLALTVAGYQGARPTGPVVR